MTISTLSNKIDAFPEAYKEKNLEAYLRAMLRLVIAYKDQEFSLDLALKIITEAFKTAPLPINPDWLTIERSPDENRMNVKFTNPEFADALDKTNTSALLPLDFTLEVLYFQISDLYKMKDKQLKDEYRYFGIDSETGNRWYNFDPIGNLSCGIRCMEDNEIDTENPDWSFLGELLENGRIYE